MHGNELHCQLRGYSITTAEILYYMPDHRALLQTFVWQDYDLAPRFPKLIRFLDFWRRHLEGPLASVRVAHKGIIGAHEMRYVGSEWRLH